MISINSQFFLLVFFIQLNFLLINCQKVRIQAKNPQHLTRINDNNYIVNIKNVKDEFKLTCSCQKCSSIKFSFSNTLKEFFSEIPDSGSVGYKETTIQEVNSASLLSTGLYTCVSKSTNDVSEMIKYYIYFFPNNGALFLPKPFQKVLFRLKTSFSVPCLALHPDVSVTHDTITSNGDFNYNPQAGLVGTLVKDQKSIKCTGSHNGISETQVYELQKIDIRVIDLTTSKNVNPVRSENREYYDITALRGGSFSVFCETKFDCSYHSYDFEFITNGIDQTEKTIGNLVLNRSLCTTPQSSVQVKKEMKLSKLNENIEIYCSLIFTRNLVAKTEKYQVQLQDKPFITFSENYVVQPDYGVGDNSNAASLVDIRIDFTATSIPKQTWYFNGKKIALAGDDKYNEFCLQESALNFTCQLQILTFVDSDAGFYKLELEILSETSIKNSINFTLIAPKKPELTILRPRDCSSNFTCEFKKNIDFSCKSVAHDVDSLLMFNTSCKNLDECYKLSKNETQIDKLIEDFKNDYFDEELILDGSISIADVKRNLFIDQPYLLTCVSSNSIGHTVRNIIMIPSDIKQGNTTAAKYVNPERINDTEVVEGDEFIIKYDFVHQIFDKNTLKYSKPNIHCVYTVSENQTEYTFSHILTFKNVTQMCTHNFNFEINSRKHQYLNETMRRNSVNITVFKPQAPDFTQPFNLSTNNITVISLSEISKNNYQIFSDGDQTITLDCRSDGKPKPTVTWLKNGSVFDTSDILEFTFLDNKQRLRILRSHSSDSGLYECIVKNRDDFNKRSFNIVVRSTVIISKTLSAKQKAFIGAISVAASILFILLIIAIGYVIYQKRLNDSLKAHHRKLLDFLNYNGEPLDDLNDVERFINTKLEYLEKLKFDEKQWEINPANFYIDESKVLGQGNFGKVCVAFISHSQAIRDEEEVKKADLSFQGPGKQGLKRHLSFKSKHTVNQNYEPSGVTSSTNAAENDTKIPLLPNDARKAAVKMAKDYKVNSSNIDSLLQELKIMAHIGHHLNIIQLIGSCTSQLITHGIAYVFSEYCEKGDLKNWLNKNASRGRYSQISDPKTSLIHEHKKRFRQSVNDVIEFSKSEKTTEEPKFNDSDLVFFCYQIAKGMEFLAKKRFLHRDLAARNILLTKNYECKISDFGLADESKLTNATFFGTAKDTKIPAKWTAPEVFNNLRYEAKSDVWSFGIVIWEIFTLGKSDPYPQISNADFKEYKDKIFNGQDEIASPENGSNEIHGLMRKCLEVDHGNRPSFEQLVPVLENHVSDVHKQYYSLISEAFKKQSIEYKNNFRKSNISRNSSEVKSSISDQYFNTPNYNKIDSIKNNDKDGSVKNKINIVNNTNPIDEIKIVDRYLEPSTPKKSQMVDTYGGYIDDIQNDSNTNTDDRYLDGLKGVDNRSISRINNDDQNNKLERPPSKPPIPPKPKHISLVPNIKITDTTLESNEKDETEGYILPRYGSGVSTSSNFSTSSTTPLNKSNGEPKPMPRRYNNKPKNIYKPGNINESDV